MKGEWWEWNDERHQLTWQGISEKLISPALCLRSHGASALSVDYVGRKIWLLRDKGMNCLLVFLLHSLFISLCRSESACRWKSSPKCAGTFAIRLLPRQRTTHAHAHRRALSRALTLTGRLSLVLNLSITPSPPPVISRPLHQYSTHLSL